MEKIKVKKNGKIYYYNFNDKIEEYELEEIDPFLVLYYLKYRIELEENFTLRDYFKTIINYKLLQFLDPFFEGYIKEFENCPKNGCTCKEIKYLCLERFIEFQKEKEINMDSFLKELDNDSDVTKIDENIERYLDFHGYGYDEEGNFISWGIDFSPLNELLDLEIKIGGCTLQIEKENFNYDTKKIENDSVNLFEFVKNIIWELSFYGVPEERKNQKEILNQRIDKVEKYHLDNE